MSDKLPSEEVQRLLKTVVEHFDNEDRAVRERQIRTWRRLKLFWDGLQRVYYSEVAHDWRVYPNEQYQENDQAYYDKPANIFKAYLESIIAALSVTVPPIKCYPDDADNSLDLSTAKAGDKIAQLIYRHNDVPLLWLHALFVFCTEGLLAAYTYTKKDEAYGVYTHNEYEEATENHEIAVCPLCGFEIEDRILDEFSNQERDEYNPGPDDVAIKDILNTGQDICPACGEMVDPEYRQDSVIITRIVGTTTEPKARQCIDVFGGLYVKIPVYARKQSDCPYLIYSYETHYANILEEYPHLRDKLRAGEGKVGQSAGIYNAYEQWGRLSTQYLGEYPRNVNTVRNAWLRPASFNILQEEESERLKKLYPDGAKVVLVNDEFAEACNAALDDSWTLSYNPLADYLHHDPLGMLLVSMQELTNDLISLTVQTIEHGIPQTFADPNVLNFDQYRQQEVAPGSIYPAVPKSGKSVSDAFYEVKTSTLSAEVMPFGDRVQQMAQMVTGALPSIFGGQLSESKTASEYAMSRSQALQRLQNTWKLLTMWWKNVFGKVIPAQMKLIQDDERNVERNQFGEFVNSYIRYAELQGKLGRVELEANENLPMTWQQQKDVVMQLLQAGNPEILGILGAPENLPLIRNAIGLTDFFVPNEDDMEKQYDEIKQLINSEPITIPVDPTMAMQAQMMGMPPPQPQEVPSVEVDPDIDNHELEFEACRSWLISMEGRVAKVDNPNGYRNVLLHAKMHLMIMQQQQMMAAQAQGSVPGAKPKEDTNTPIKQESDVNVNA